MTLIDTSAWIEFLRRSGDLTAKGRVAFYVEVGSAAICGPIELELLAGARRSEVGDIQTAVALCTNLDFNSECWRLAATMDGSLRAKGVTVPRDDIFVAAASMHHGVHLCPRFSLRAHAR